MAKQYVIINNVVGWLVFTFAAGVYCLTMEPTVSLWDCGEFIAAAYKLQVMHPPGAPFFGLVGRLFTMLAPDVEWVAWMMNLSSALCSGFAILFLFWTVTALGRRIMLRQAEDYTTDRILAVMGAGIVGGLACTFADSFWFSAVEGEVYAMSSFFTALVFWSIMKWERIADETYADKWLVFIAFMVGLSISVHLLSLLVVPACVFVYYFRKYEFTRQGILKVFLIASAIVGFIQYGIITMGLPALMAKTELFFVNGMGLPFDSGVLFFVLLVAGLLLWGIYYTHQRNKPVWNMALLCLTFIMIGYSTYTMLVIRSNANPSIDMNDPGDPFNLVSFLSREQYGERPLLYGQYFTAEVVRTEQGGEKYYKDTQAGKYKVKGHKMKQIFDPAHQTIFPRTWSNRERRHTRIYRSMMNLEKGEKPTFGDNLSFFVNYQLGYMYWRYFMWNFSGRQNDIQGVQPNYKKGNWLSGIPFIDEVRLGPQHNLPATMLENNGRNTFYMLPFILGLIGLFYHFKKHQEDAFVVFLLFFFTGIAIVLYLNQEPAQPRERDYSYAGSIYAYAIWIGIGTLALFEFFQQYTSRMVSAVAACGLALIPPSLMGMDGWDDHTRADRYFARDFAVNYLESCPPNAILFTQGDNDTYPLWYLQEVEGVRTDVRIVNLSLLSVDWYIEQLHQKENDAAPVPFSLRPEHYRGNTRDYVPYYERAKISDKRYPLWEIMNFIKDDTRRSRVQTRSGTFIDYLPSQKFKIEVDPQELLAQGVITEAQLEQMDTVMTWDISKGHLIKRDVMLLDLIAENARTGWKRPICFAVSVSPDVYLGLDKYFQLEGLTYRVLPVPSEGNLRRGQADNIGLDVMFENVMNKFQWGNTARKNIHFDENLRRIALNHRIQMTQLAEALNDAGRPTDALKVLDKSIEALPHTKVPYDAVMIQHGVNFYRAGAPEKARKLLKKIFELYEEEVDYYVMLEGDVANAFHRDFQQAVAILQELVRITGQQDDEELEEAFKERFQRVRELAAPLMQQQQRQRPQQPQPQREQPQQQRQVPQPPS